MSMNGNKNNLLLPESAATQCVTTSLVRGHPGPALASISNKQSFPEVKDEKKGEKVLRTIPAHTASPADSLSEAPGRGDYPRTHGVTPATIWQGTHRLHSPCAAGTAHL
jgi:hypothetical protein